MRMLYCKVHCLKSTHIRRFSGLFPCIRTAICFVNLRIQFECGKIWTKKTPNADSFLRGGDDIIFSLKNKRDVEVFLDMGRSCIVITRLLRIWRFPTRVPLVCSVTLWTQLRYEPRVDLQFKLRKTWWLMNMPQWPKSIVEAAKQRMKK